MSIRLICFRNYTLHLLLPPHTLNHHIHTAYNVASTIPSTTTHHKGIVALLPLSPIILAATNEGVAMFNSGCMRQGDYNLQQPNQTNQSSVQTNLTDTPVDLCTNEAVYDGPNQVVTHATVATRMGKLKVRTNGLK